MRLRERVFIRVIFVTLLMGCREMTVAGAQNIIEKAGYIDTHKHILGFIPPGLPTSETIQEGIGRQQRFSPGPGRQRPGRPGMRPHFGRGPGGRWGYPGAGYQNARDEIENLNKAADNLIAHMDELGIEKTLIVVVPSRSAAEEEYRKMRNAVARYPERLRLMAGGSLLGEVLQEIAPTDVTQAVREQFRKTAEKILREGAVGFGEMISYHLCMKSPGHSFQETPADHPLFLLLADIAAENDVPIDLHMEAIEYERPMPENLLRASGRNPPHLRNPLVLKPTIPALERLLVHNRKARIVWQHIGWDNTGDMRIELLRRLLKTHPNLYMAVRVEERIFQVGGSSLPMPNRIVDESGMVRPEWLELFSEFPDRFMIGSDEFVFATSTEVGRSTIYTWSILEQLPPELARKIGRENAVSVYRLE